MERRTRKLVILFIVGLSFWPASSDILARQRSGNQPPADQPAGEKARDNSIDGSADVESDTSDKKPDNPSPQASSDTRFLAKLKKLQSAMRAKLDLKPEQDHAIDQLFNDYFTALDRRQKTTGAAGGTVDRRLDLQRLRQEIADAAKAGDEDKVRALRQRVHAFMQTKQQAYATALAPFLQKIGAVLNKNQQSRFEKLVRQLKIKRSRPRVDRHLRTLYRALLTPTLRFPPKRRRELVKIVLQGSKTIRQMKKGDAAIEQEVSRIRAEVDKQLTSRQRERLHSMMKIYDHRRKFHRPLRGKTTAREGRTGVVHPPEKDRTGSKDPP